MIKPGRVGLLASVAAAVTLLSAPIALADNGHGDNHRGRDGDDHAVVVQSASEDLSEDVVEQRDEIQVAPAQPQPVIDNDQEVNDLNDDD